jgi:hypothetical protein
MLSRDRLLVLCCASARPWVDAGRWRRNWQGPALQSRAHFERRGNPWGANESRPRGKRPKGGVSARAISAANYAQMSTFFTKLITSARYCHFLLVFGSRFVLSFLSLTVERLALICSRGLDSASVVSGRSVQGDLSHRQSRGKRARPQRILFRSGTPTGLYELLLS